MARQEFTKAVKVEIIKRATVNGQVYCEACGVQCRTFHIDHDIPDGLKVDKSKPLTAEDGKLLCAGTRETCHGIKTATKDVPAIAKAKRCENRHLGIKGRPTKLSGPPRSEKDQIKAAQSEARRTEGKFPVPRPRSLYATISDPQP